MVLPGWRRNGGSWIFNSSFGMDLGVYSSEQRWPGLQASLLRFPIHVIIMIIRVRRVVLLTLKLLSPRPKKLSTMLPNVPHGTPNQLITPFDFFVLLGLRLKILLARLQLILLHSMSVKTSTRTMAVVATLTTTNSTPLIAPSTRRRFTPFYVRLGQC